MSNDIYQTRNRSKLKISIITGEYYSHKNSMKTWHNNKKIKKATILATMFNFELCKPETHQNLINSVKTLEHLYHVEKLSPSEFVTKFSIKDNRLQKYFGNFLEEIGIVRRTRKEAVNNFFEKTGKLITDEKELYWKKSKFLFDVYKFPNIIGYDLLTKNMGWYHPKNNPTGIQRDHMLSISYGWENSIDPSIISHPANCHIMTAQENNIKNNGNSISIEQLKKRILEWDSVSELSSLTKIISKRRKSALTDNSKENLRLQNINKFHYTNGVCNIRIKDGSIIPDGFYKGLTVDNKQAIGQLIDWKSVQIDIDNGISRKLICKKYNITYNTIRWAKNKKYINCGKNIPFTERFNIEKIKSDINQGASVKKILIDHSMNYDQYRYCLKLLK